MENRIKNKRAQFLIKEIKRQMQEMGVYTNTLDPIIYSYADAYDKYTTLTDVESRGDFDTFDKEHIATKGKYYSIMLSSAKYLKLEKLNLTNESTDESGGGEDVGNIGDFDGFEF